jgi:protein TonB
MSTALFAGAIYALGSVTPITITLGPPLDLPPMAPIDVERFQIKPQPPQPKAQPQPRGDSEPIDLAPPAAPATSIPLTTFTFRPIDIVQPKIVDAHWIRRPSRDELLDFYPAGALDRGVGGRVVLNCLVGAGGGIECAVLSETPRGQGFARAALAASRLFRMAPATADGRPTEGGRIEVPIVFDPPKS